MYNLFGITRCFGTIGPLRAVRDSDSDTLLGATGLIAAMHLERRLRGEPRISPGHAGILWTSSCV